MTTTGRTAKWWTVVGVAIACAVGFSAPAQADSVRWGPRVGVGLDPDQFIMGVHFRPGPIANDLYLQPNVQLGVGDDVTLFSVAVPLHYHFDTSFSAKPYAGGGVSMGVWSGDGDDDFEVSIDLVGGLEWTLNSGNLFFTELKFGLGDLHDVELIGGWMF